MTPSANVPDPAGSVPEAQNRVGIRPADSPLPKPQRRPRRRAWVAILLALVGAVAVGGWLLPTFQASQQWRKAQAALQRHDLAAALDHLDRYLEYRPDDANGWFLVARTARRFSRYRDAERCLERCQQLGGVTAATRLEWDLLRVQQGDLGETHLRLRQTTPPDHPDAPFVLEALARGYMQTGRLLDEMEACDLWRSLQPDHPWPWLWRGGVFERLGNFHEAWESYTRALESAPDDRDVRLALAGLFSRGRRPGDAAEHFEHLLARSPDDEEALLGLAACRIEQGRVEDATPLLDRLLAKDSPPARALFLRGRAALQRGDAAGAEGWLARAARQAPDDAEALHQLILALRGQGKHAEADRLAPRLEALRRDLDRLGVLVRAVGRNPDDAKLRHEAGVVSLRLGRDDEGVGWLQSALRARGDHRPTHAALAEHYARRGDPRADHHRRLAPPPEKP